MAAHLAQGICEVNNGRLLCNICMFLLMLYTYKSGFIFQPPPPPPAGAMLNLVEQGSGGNHFMKTIVALTLYHTILNFNNHENAAF